MDKINTDFGKLRRLAKNWLRVSALTSLALSICPSAFAAGTAANTTVTNSFAIDYAADGEFVAHNDRIQTTDIRADELFWIAVRSNIPSAAGINGGTSAQVTLIAETMEPSTSENSGTAIHDDINYHNSCQNIFADKSGSSHEVANDGDHSDSASYSVDGVKLTVERAFSVHSQTGANCSNLTTPATDGFAIPVACVEYKFSIKNMGSFITAENITLQNTLDTTLNFARINISGFPGGDLVQPSFEVDCASTACNINFSEASLPPSATGIVTIRALLK